MKLLTLALMLALIDAVRFPHAVATPRHFRAAVTQMGEDSGEWGSKWAGNSQKILIDRTTLTKQEWLVETKIAEAKSAAKTRDIATSRARFYEKEAQAARDLADESAAALEDVEEALGKTQAALDKEQAQAAKAAEEAEEVLESTQGLLRAKTMEVGVPPTCPPAFYLTIARVIVYGRPSRRARSATRPARR